ncbi:MAG: terminase family protein, partial [Chitinophagaceae bacterium]
MSQPIKIKLPQPHPGQVKVIESTARNKVLMCGRQWGKTLVCRIISINLMLSSKALAYVTPTHLLGREFYQELLKLLPAEIIQSDNQTDRKIVLKTGGSIKFFSGEALDQFRGNKFHYVIIDEAAFIPDLKAAWKAIRPTLMFYQGSSIWISTPNGKDFFYQQYLRGKNKEKDWESFHFSSLDNPTLSKEE